MMLIKTGHIALLAIVFCVLGCSEDIIEPTEGQEATEATVYRIPAMVVFQGTLYLAGGEDGFFRLNTQKLSWELLPRFVIAESLALNGGRLYIGSWGEINLLTQWNPPTLIKLSITQPQDKFPEPVEAVAIVNNMIYAIEGNQFFRSEDGGFHWHQINITGFVDEKNITSMEVNRNTIYVFANPQGVFRSLDGGNSWIAINQGLPDRLLTNPPLIFNQNTVYIGTPEGVYRLPKDTTTWMPTGLPHLSVHALVVTDNRLYAAVSEVGVFRSDDGGKNWRHIGLEGIRVATLTVVGNRLFVGVWDRKGVFYTDDDGASWHPLNKGLKNPY